MKSDFSKFQIDSVFLKSQYLYNLFQRKLLHSTSTVAEKQSWVYNNMTPAELK